MTSKQLMVRYSTLMFVKKIVKENGGNNMKKRIIATLIATVLSVTTLTACGSSDSGTQSTTSTSTTTTDTGSNGPVQLTIAVQQSGTVEDYENNYFTQLLEEDMNVELTFEVFPADDSEAKSKFALLVASGTKLPDIIAFAMTDVEVYEYGTKGVFHSMTDNLADPSITPNFNALTEDYQHRIISTSLVGDGNVYSLPRYNHQIWSEGWSRMFAYTPWLEALGAEVPTTTDEFYDLLVRMKNEDPNGNGKADEVPLMGATGWGQTPFNYLMNAFVYANPNRNYFHVENGVIFPSFTTDEWHNGLEYMNKLVAEGLLDPISFTQDTTSLKAALGSTEGGTVGFIPSGSYNTFSSQEETHWKVQLIGPLTGPEGVNCAMQTPTTANNCWMITSTCEHVDVAIALGDYFYKKEVGASARFGEEGVDWSMDPEVTSLYRSDTYDALENDTQIAIMNNLWAETNSKIWGEIGPTCRDEEMMSGVSYELFSLEKDETNSNPNFYKVFFDEYVLNFPEENIPSFPYTAEEISAITIAKTDIDAYVLEQMVAFITGNRPLSEWDSYLDTLNAMGLETYVAANQSAYDRTQ